MRAHLVPVATVAFSLLALPAAAELSCESCRLVQSVEDDDRTQRIVELENRIDSLNTEIRGINANWPTGYIVLGYSGYVAAPLGLVYGGTSLAFGLVSLATDAALGGVLIAVGVVGVLVGLAGIGAIIYAWTRGSAVAAEAKKRRDTLVDERQRLQRELDRQKSRDGGEPTAPPLVQVLTF